MRTGRALEQCWQRPSDIPEEQHAGGSLVKHNHVVKDSVWGETSARRRFHDLARERRAWTSVGMRLCSGHGKRLVEG